MIKLDLTTLSKVKELFPEQRLWLTLTSTVWASVLRGTDAVISIKSFNTGAAVLTFVIIAESFRLCYKDCKIKKSPIIKSRSF